MQAAPHAGSFVSLYLSTDVHCVLLPSPYTGLGGLQPLCDRVMPRKEYNEAILFARYRAIRSSSSSTGKGSTSSKHDVEAAKKRLYVEKKRGICVEQQ